MDVNLDGRRLRNRAAELHLMVDMVLVVVVEMVMEQYLLMLHRLHVLHVSLCCCLSRYCCLSRCCCLSRLLRCRGLSLGSRVWLLACAALRGRSHWGGSCSCWWYHAIESLGEGWHDLVERRDELIKKVSKRVRLSSLLTEYRSSDLGLLLLLLLLCPSRVRRSSRPDNHMHCLLILDPKL